MTLDATDARTGLPADIAAGEAAVQGRAPQGVGPLGAGALGIGPLSVGPLGEPFDGIERIAVLRGGGLGDLLFAMGAIQSLRAAYPNARITLLGTPMHAALLKDRPNTVDEVVVLPIAKGVRDAPGQVEDEAEVERFVERMRAERFDLALQLHGGGRFSNPFLLRLGARHTVGTRTPDAAPLERSMTYIYYQHEMLRALEVVGLAGVAPAVLEPRLTATERERADTVQHVDGDARGLVLIHPGATDPRRRWPAASFAEVAARLAADGAQVIVVGDASDEANATEIVRLARAAASETDAGRITSLAGRLSLGELVGLVSHADVLLGNDSGPRHLAQAVGAATVGIYWFGNVVNAGPLGRARQRAHLSWTTHCPVCGVDCTQVGWSAERCEHDDSFVADVPAGAVYDDVAELTATSLLLRGR
ncbi:glycosyltransferase family 9 protein [Planctomonas deserti]|uniref:glycosyltransferase family 9 protein n=1 Tax=Planctomonas deserti TaxID=2144185 RepID=UPI000D3AAC80|nr:glycosyltransferase family 9 protein [Planctomonas deserti]